MKSVMLQIGKSMKEKNKAVHQLMVDFIDQIGCTEIPENGMGETNAQEWSSWNAHYRISQSGKQWVLTLFRYQPNTPLFAMDFQRAFPSKVVADIMGRYHCRLIISSVNQINTSRPSAFPCN